jgi:hypothetical protein
MEGRYLKCTALLDIEDPRIVDLVESRGWTLLPEQDRIGAVYDFVRDEIPFSYNTSDDLPASAVLTDGYGQCNTKTTLLMALLRATGVGCRLHGATIDKTLQHGVMVAPLYWFAPRSIIHTWAEVAVGGRWVALEGVIVDTVFLQGVRATTGRNSGPLLGYGIGTEDLGSPPVDWNGTDTFIQSSGINRDLGVFDDPDDFYRRHGVNARGVKGWLYRNIMRKAMNRRVRSIRMTCAPAATLRS